MKLRQLLRQNRKFTNEDIRRYSSRFRLTPIKCRMWLKQRGADVEDEDAPSLQITPNRRRSRFFDELPHQKKIALLKKTQSMSTISSVFVQDLAIELGVPIVPLTSWLRHKKRRSSIVPKLTDEVVEVLKEEYNSDSILTVDRALLLANQLNITPTMIQTWFVNRRSEGNGSNDIGQVDVSKSIAVSCKTVTESVNGVETESNTKAEAESVEINVPVDSVVKPSNDESKVEVGNQLGESKCAKTGVKCKFKSPAQKEILFEAFKHLRGSVTPELMNDLVTATDLTPIQISKALSVLRTKLSKSSEIGLKKSLTRNITENQLRKLEKLYKQSRFVTDNDIVDIKKSINLKKFTLKGWFSNRRMYEIMSNNKNLIDTCDTDDEPDTEREVTMISEAETEALIKEAEKSLEILKNKSDAEKSVVIQKNKTIGMKAHSILKNRTDAYFKTLSKHQRLRLMKATKSRINSFANIAKSLNLPVDKVRDWIIDRRFVEQLELSFFTSGKTSFSENVLQTLKARYEQSQYISKKQTIILAKQLKLKPSQVKNWFINRRKRNKKANSNRPISAVTRSEATIKSEISSQQLPDEEMKSTETENATIQSEISPKEVPDEEMEAIETETEVETDECTQSGTKRKRKDVSQRNVLFEEYKKNPQMNISRAKPLAKQLHLTSLQVRKWFSNFRGRVMAQSLEKILECVENEAIGEENFVRLCEEYCKNRFITEQRTDVLVKQLKLSRKLIKNWFINARYYEARTGKLPHSEATPVSDTSIVPVQGLSPEQLARLNDELNLYPFDEEKIQNLATELRLTSEDVKKWLETSSLKIGRKKGRVAGGCGRLNMKKLNVLIAEFDKDNIITYDRAKTLCPKVKISIDRIMTWFENRRKAMAEKNVENSIEEIKVDSATSISADENLLPAVSSEQPSDAIISSEQIVNKTEPREDDKKTDTPVTETTPISASKGKRSYPSKMPLQQNHLFEEFKKSSFLPSSRVIRLTKQTELSEKQITAWFQWMRSKLESVSKESLSDEIRNKNLTTPQIEILEKEYAKNRYISRERREDLSAHLRLSKNTVKMWFASRRYHEILSDIDKKEPDLAEAQNHENQCEDNSVPTTNTSMNCNEQDVNANINEKSNPEKKRKRTTSVKRKVDLNSTKSVDDVSATTEKADSSDANLTNILSSNQLDPGTSESTEESFELSDYTSLPYEERHRSITFLGNDLNPIEDDVEILFWYMNKTPNQKSKYENGNINSEKNRSLEVEFEKNPWPTLDRISFLSNKLKVSEPKIHWWFIKKRCLLTKTIAVNPLPPKSVDEPKNVVIDLTDDNISNSVNTSHEESSAPEFVALSELEIKKEAVADDGENDDKICDKITGQENSSDKSSVSQVSDPSLNETTYNSKHNHAPLIPVKKKKSKIVLTSHQRAILLQEFRRCKFISGSKARMLANDLGLSVNKVDAWFENMRNNAEKKITPSETPCISLEKLSTLVVAELEKEFKRSQNLSEKRAKMIALRLKITKKIVRHWFFEQSKKNCNQ